MTQKCWLREKVLTQDEIILKLKGLSLSTISKRMDTFVSN